METNALTRRQMLQWSGTAGLAGLAVAASPVRAPAATPSYRKAVLAKKPVGYWRLGDMVLTTAIDASLNRRHGKYHGNPKSTPGALRADADPGIALDGKSYVEIRDHAQFSQPTSGAGLTVEAWVRPDVLVFEGETSDAHVHWLGKGEAGRQEWGLRFYSKKSKRPNRISAYLWTPAGGLGAGAYFEDALKPGEWIHVVACYDPGDADTQGKPGVHIYKNGVRRGGPPSAGTLYDNPRWQIKPAHGAAPLRLGTRDRKSFLTGGLDEVAIYPRVLTAREILEHYQLARAN
jgi:Concanavalin A-like lectin/glucanases superfamily